MVAWADERTFYGVEEINMPISLNNFKRMTVACSLGLAIASISANSAQAVVIDFQDITNHVNGISLEGDIV